MSVNSISVHNVRSHELYSTDIHSETTLIIGHNGTGKTTLIEAIYFLHRGTSFRGRDRDLILHGKTSAELKIKLDSDETRRVLLSLTSEGRVTKSFVIGDKKSARLAPIQKLPLVLFEPDELRLLTSSPQRRRDFIDGIIARLSPTYQMVLNRFARTLLQRNELLKQFGSIEHTAWESHLFAWDVKLAELSASIIKARRNFILHSNEHLSRLYSQLAKEAHTVTAHYQGQLDVTDKQLQQALLHLLESCRQQDGIRGFTSVGPHRDDIILQLDHHPASDAASRGEMRSIMLAFKLLEVELQEHHSGQKPLILLDDVFSELDSGREQALLKSLRPYQTIITATDLRDSSLQDDVHIISLT